MRTDTPEINKTKRYLVDILTWVCRLLTGGVFIFSGFTKAVDPIGTVYKITDYINAMGIGAWPSLIVFMAFVLFSVEFAVGVFLVLGCFRRSAPVMATLIMAVMLPLTLWIAISNPVEDCGCFGDALIISNWATFWKNVLLTACAVWLLIYNRKCRCLIKPPIQWFAFIATGCFIVLIGFIGYNYQPLMDFRPYKTGTALLDGNTATDTPEVGFIYEKDGVRKTFGIDDELPDEADGWKFIARTDEDNKKEKPKVAVGAKNFSIWSEDGMEDVTADVVDTDSRQLMMLIPDVANISIASSWKINSLYSWAESNGIDMFAVIAGDSVEIENWKDLFMPSYPIFTSDDTSIKEVARGNPALVYMEKGIIKWKNSLLAIDTDDFQSPETSADPMQFAHDDTTTLKSFSYTYISVMAVLILLSTLPWMKRLFTGRMGRRFMHGDKVLPEESCRHDKPAQ